MATKKTRTTKKKSTAKKSGVDPKATKQERWERLIDYLHHIYRSRKK